ncbi:hypothetical protein QN224_32370 [Sinorhizobium sp. 8-89]|uniref:hypothetical protein n=1 Tax=Sinorhizobium sp. 7-81 TaxID=3049087 RepID=UPI0024C2891A|nr:hypothetical protein [Sinorhizobium sp. 7-81]MDK1390015.1 hypothetical protein [Sinorhizobium sp. 7-81]
MLVEGDVSAGEQTGTFAGPAFIDGASNAAGYDSSHDEGAEPAQRRRPSIGMPTASASTGYYLVVDDNDNCDGQGVTLNGVYIKKAASR